MHYVLYRGRDGDGYEKEAKNKVKSKEQDDLYYVKRGAKVFLKIKSVPGTPKHPIVYIIPVSLIPKA